MKKDFELLSEYVAFLRTFLDRYNVADLPVFKEYRNEWIAAVRERYLHALKDNESKLLSTDTTLPSETWQRMVKEVSGDVFYQYFKEEL